MLIGRFVRVRFPAAFGPHLVSRSSNESEYSLQVGLLAALWTDSHADINLKECQDDEIRTPLFRVAKDITILPNMDAPSLVTTISEVSANLSAVNAYRSF